MCSRVELQLHVRFPRIPWRHVMWHRVKWRFVFWPLTTRALLLNKTSRFYPLLPTVSLHLRPHIDKNFIWEDRGPWLGSRKKISSEPVRNSWNITKCTLIKRLTTCIFRKKISLSAQKLWLVVCTSYHTAINFFGVELHVIWKKIQIQKVILFVIKLTSHTW